MSRHPAEHRGARHPVATRDLILCCLLSLTCTAAFVGAAQAGSITGDTYTLTVSDLNATYGSAVGTAGSSPANISTTESDATVTWLDEDTFKLEFNFHLTGPPVYLYDATLALTDLDFVGAGNGAEDIVFLTEISTEHGWSYALSVDAHSITLVYSSLSPPQSADGDAIVFDVTTAPTSVCVSGPDDGAACASAADCAGTCLAGLSAGNSCLADSDCTGACETIGGACADDSDCPISGYCSATFNVGCMQQSDCPDTFLCVGAPQDGDPCANDVDCGDFQYGTCTDDICSSGPLIGQACFDDFDCESFVAGNCAQAPSTCEFDVFDTCAGTGTCDRQATCAPTICNEGSTEGESCANDSECGGACAGGPGITGGPCFEDLDCPGACFWTGNDCFTDVECPDILDGYCNEGNGFCTSDAECLDVGHCASGPSAGYLCDGGFECEEWVPGACSGGTCVAGAVGLSCMDDYECDDFLQHPCNFTPDPCIVSTTDDFCELGSSCLQTAECVAMPACPVHRWRFDEAPQSAGAGTIVVDSTCGADGVVQGTGASLNGQAIQLPGGPSGTAAYVDLPNGLISGLQDVTFEAWYTIEGARSWARVFDFGASNGEEIPPGPGGGGSSYVVFSPERGGDINLQRTEALHAGTFGGVDMALPSVLSQQYHVAVTVDGNGGGAGISRVTTYRDGVQVSQFTVAVQPADIMNVNNWVGRSNYLQDASFQGRVAEFRLYTQSLTSTEVADSYAAGPDAPVLLPEPGAVGLAAGATLLAMLARRRAGRARARGVALLHESNSLQSDCR
jgi:hypothetical protein